MNIILEDKWTVDGEADDIIEYCKKNNYVCHILTYDEIYNYDTYEFFKCIYFCNTDLVQYHLKKKNIDYIVPNTYENIYSEFYNRIITIKCLGDINIDSLTEPLFIKPIENDKTFDGTVLSKNDLYAYNVILASLTKPINEHYVYTSKIIKFTSEYRLLIGNNKLYGYGHMCGDYKKFDIDINKLIELTNDKFRCIDIGFDKKINKWIIVEINPPFSLDDCDIPFDSYMTFCIDACLWINKCVQ
jgi:hypothetical protein